MREQVIRDYLAGRIGVAALRAEIERAQRQAPAEEQVLEREFELLRRHLVALCDAVLERELPASGLPLVARCLLHSSRFVWPGRHPEGRVVEEVLVAWQRVAPQTLGASEVAWYREWLLAGRAPERGRLPA